MLWLFFSSFLTALSMPGFVAGCIVWFSLVPFLKSLEKKGPLFGALYGFLYFYAFSAINLYWVLPVLMENMPRTFGKFHALTGFLVFLLMLAFEALPFAAFGFLYGLLENSVKKHPIKEVLLQLRLILFSILSGALAKWGLREVLCLTPCTETRVFYNWLPSLVRTG